MPNNYLAAFAGLLAEHGTTALLTTQYLDDGEQLADRIAILHEGRIVVLAELKRLLPPTRVEFVEKQPTLEDIFFAIIGDRDRDRDRDQGSRSAICGRSTTGARQVLMRLGSWARCSSPIRRIDR